MNWQGKQVLVTGGGSGIGREIVKQLHAHGADVVVASLVQAELDSLAGELASGPGSLLSLPMDLTADGAVEALMAELEQRNIRLDVLVNNAGTALYGNHVELDPKRIRTMLTLNIQVLSELASAVARQMIAQGTSGNILNVASIGAFVPVPRLAAYSASKHYVLAFSHALAEELAPYGIHVGVLCPGITRTPIYDAMGLESGNQTKGSVSQLADTFSMAPESVAVCALQAIEKKQRVALPGLNKAVPLTGLIPAWISARFMRRMSDGRQAK